MLSSCMVQGLEKHMQRRPTTMAAAFINAAVKAENITHDLSDPKVDHWVARRVALNATERGNLFGTVREPGLPRERRFDGEARIIEGEEGYVD
jgi:hypothetical protein